MRLGEIRGSGAAWVLFAHVYALAVPFVLVFVVYRHWDYVATVADFPGLLFLAVGLLLVGSACEIVQNVKDDWYITADTASGKATGFFDMLFCGFITAGQATVALAISGGTWWVVLIAICAIAVFPFCYRSGPAAFAPLAVTGLLAVLMAYLAFGDPLVFIGLGMTPLTLYFFSLLLKTGAQVLHGFTTACAASGIWFFAEAIANGAAGMATRWTTLAAFAAGCTIVLALLWPRLIRLSATPRASAR